MWAWCDLSRYEPLSNVSPVAVSLVTQLYLYGPGRQHACPHPGAMQIHESHSHTYARTHARTHARPSQLTFDMPKLGTPKPSPVSACSPPVLLRLLTKPPSATPGLIREVASDHLLKFLYGWLAFPPLALLSHLSPLSHGNSLFLLSSRVA